MMTTFIFKEHKNKDKLKSIQPKLVFLVILTTLKGVQIGVEPKSKTDLTGKGSTTKATYHISLNYKKYISKFFQRY